MAAFQAAGIRIASGMLGRLPLCRTTAAVLMATLVLIGSAPVSHAAPAAPANGTLDRLKSATAYLELPNGYGSGTAFCISTDGYFVTCAHVVSGLKNGDNVELVLNPGAPKEQKLKAAVTRVDSDHDIAILKAPANASATVLTLVLTHQVFQFRRWRA